MTHVNHPTGFWKIAGGKKVAVMCFHSTRSAYSRRTVQMLVALEREFPMAEFCLVDADCHLIAPLLFELRIVALPTIELFRSGQRAECLVGERSPASLLKFLAGWLSGLASPGEAP